MRQAEQGAVENQRHHEKSVQAKGQGKTQCKGKQKKEPKRYARESRLSDDEQGDGPAPGYSPMTDRGNDRRRQ